MVIMPNELGLGEDGRISPISRLLGLRRPRRVKMPPLPRTPVDTPPHRPAEMPLPRSRVGMPLPGPPAETPLPRPVENVPATTPEETQEEKVLNQLRNVHPHPVRSLDDLDTRSTVANLTYAPPRQSVWDMKVDMDRMMQYWERRKKQAGRKRAREEDSQESTQDFSNKRQKRDGECDGSV
ncbi:hypothetical protein BU23DRAFT_227266 [Bimuria novae-zelandiae CBS 107.79]|uniref:Uncharacterized protein n=1 Tax=Bimuria novae-zelandiae CBS 107.79 TaxID=1447943 RepID=A0A6A5VML2_9PLEO|nr:hypothetical protein BU23DRAFT_227266 [Bimuria novae-zelandiae CBS 107.79]